MTSARTANAGRPRKSPLRADTMPRSASDLMAAGGLSAGAAAGRRGAGSLSAADLRQMMITEFCTWLGEQLTREGRPFQAHTITNYMDAAKVLNRWMTEQKVDGDFTACDPVMLNKFFADYLKTYTQGGTNTLQRNLAHLFAWLDQVYDHPTPYTSKLNRYVPADRISQRLLSFSRIFTASAQVTAPVASRMANGTRLAARKPGPVPPGTRAAACSFRGPRRPRRSRRQARPHRRPGGSRWPAGP
jgi:hypothetical protein